jgi:hypothetical protein
MGNWIFFLGIQEHVSDDDKKAYRNIFGSFSTHNSLWLPNIVLTYGTTFQSKCRLCSYDNLRTNAFTSVVTEIGAEDLEHGSVIVLMAPGL